jgi:hypothetical protein
MAEFMVKIRAPHIIPRKRDLVNSQVVGLRAQHTFSNIISGMAECMVSLIQPVTPSVNTPSSASVLNTPSAWRYN